MKTPEKKTKADYNFTPVHIRGDRKYVNSLKSNAAQAGISLADYIRECLDYAQEGHAPSFFFNDGTRVNQSGKG